MDICFKILEDSYKRTVQRSAKSFIADRGARERIEVVALCLKNRAGVRALLAGLLAKIRKRLANYRWVIFAGGQNS